MDDGDGSRPPIRKTNMGEMAIFNTVLYINTVLSIHRILLAGFRALGHEYPDELSKPIMAFVESLARHETIGPR
jgi:hypothetical protein